MTPSRLLVPLSAVLLVAGCGTDPARTAAPSTSPSATAASATPSPTRAAEDEVDAVVEEFLTVLGETGSRRAWDLLSSRSQEGFGSFEAFEDLSTDYAEGLAAYAEVGRSTLELSAELSVVTLSGEVTREGTTETDAYALPVRHEERGPRVELPPATAPLAVSIEVPERGAGPVGADTELRAVVPAMSTVTVVLDGRTVPANQSSSDGDRTLVTLMPELTLGPHVLTVVAVRADGLLLAQAGAFSVA